MGTVSAAKPITVAGGIFWAPLGTTLPTDATSTLSTSTWKCLGYISEDGVTNSQSKESSDVKCWGNQNIATLQTGSTDTFSFKLLEATNPDVLKAVFGANNVTGTLATGITVKVDGTEVPAACWVIDMKIGSNLQRIVIGNGTITEMGDIVYKDSELIGYDVTISAVPHVFAANDIAYHKEYKKTPSA